MARRPRSSFVRSACLALTLIALGRHAARAQVVTEFNVLAGNSDPVSITAGPDGALWFVEQGVNRIGRITPLGVFTEFSAGINPSASFGGITSGPDGNLWFTERDTDQVGRITPLGVVTEFGAGISPFGQPLNITAGPDGNLWFTEAANRIGRITPAGVVTEFAAGITPSAFLTHITTGPDGNLWFTEQNANQIGRITPAGVVTEFSAGISPFAQPFGITAGPDGNIWFTEANGPRIGRITPAGVVTEFSVGITPGAQPLGIAAGPDGNLWFVEMAVDGIARITPAGVVTEFPGFAAGPSVSELTAVVAGPDGNVWFTAIAFNVTSGSGIARITTAPDVATTFHPLTPCRVLDTRDVPSALGGPALAAGAKRDFAVTGTCGIPATAVSLSANVTITQAASAGSLYTLPAGLPVLGVRPGLTRANNAFLLLARDSSGVLSFSNDIPSGALHLIVDVNGWWE
jgi:virginiamycin B lyase